MQEERQLRAVLANVEGEFAKANSERLRKDKVPLPDDDIQALLTMLNVTPLHFGIVDAAAREPQDPALERPKLGFLNHRAPR